MIFAKSHVLSAVAVAILTLTGIQGGQADAQLLRSSISIGSYGYGLGGYGYRSYYGGSGLLRSRTSISYRSHIRYPRYGYSAYG